MSEEVPYWKEVLEARNRGIYNDNHAPRGKLRNHCKRVSPLECSECVQEMLKNTNKQIREWQTPLYGNGKDIKGS